MKKTEKRWALALRGEVFWVAPSKTCTRKAMADVRLECDRLVRVTLTYEVSDA